jgi:hypothetical protein
VASQHGGAAVSLRIIVLAEFVLMQAMLLAHTVSTVAQHCDSLRDYCCTHVLSLCCMYCSLQARCMAAKTPQIATLSCILAGIATFIVGVPFAYLGGFARLYYGPDSPYAEFEADTYVKCDTEHSSELLPPAVLAILSLLLLS